MKNSAKSRKNIEECKMIQEFKKSTVFSKWKTSRIKAKFKGWRICWKIPKNEQLYRNESTQKS